MRPVLLRPVLSEKSSTIESLGKYVFEVATSANKIEIKRAVEDKYSVKVTDVHTVSLRPRNKSRWTGRGFMSGKTKKRKKAIVTLAKGQTLDVLGDLEQNG